MVRVNERNREKAVCGNLCPHPPQILPHSSSIYDSHSSKHIRAKMEPFSSNWESLRHLRNEILHVLKERQHNGLWRKTVAYRTLESASDFFPWSSISCCLLDNSTRRADQYQIYTFGPKRFSFLGFLFSLDFLIYFWSHLWIFFSLTSNQSFYSKNTSFIPLRN